jgi:hypothetical protein
MECHQAAAGGERMVTLHKTSWDIHLWRSQLCIAGPVGRPLGLQLRRAGGFGVQEALDGLELGACVAPANVSGALLHRSGLLVERADVAAGVIRLEERQVEGTAIDLAQ